MCSKLSSRKEYTGQNIGPPSRIGRTEIFRFLSRLVDHINSYLASSSSKNVIVKDNAQIRRLSE
ncbi:hypothetical protein T07_14272 [Trichinella nelsoni]|uniref:Uncharacterized protein n=1 Tax=Trichinella nelsoni TaxID=6336 RepID=A0A0V0SHU5_9BILA|nr:hypothetical protein T07_14272 [Trichinella nelsoni]